MFVETLDQETRLLLFEKFFGETAAALVQVLGKSEREAARLVDEVRCKFSFAPKTEQDWLLHDDPVVLAAELAEVSWSEIDQPRLESFNNKRRAAIESEKLRQ